MAEKIKAGKKNNTAAFRKWREDLEAKKKVKVRGLVEKLNNMKAENRRLNEENTGLKEELEKMKAIAEAAKTAACHAPESSQPTPLE